MNPAEATGCSFQRALGPTAYNGHLVIVRPDGDRYLLITQPDHAALAARLMDGWQRDGFVDSPRRDTILFATAHHDDGWREYDAAPMMDPASGRIFDFMSAPAAVRQNVWPRAVERLASAPYAAALVAQHAVTVYEPNRGEPLWDPFLARMERLRDAHLTQAAPLTAGDLDRDYFFVRMGDLLSLTFCCGWLEPRHYRGYDVRWSGSRLVVQPDPFDGRDLEFSIDARSVRTHASSVQEFRDAQVTTLAAVASGS